MMARHAVHAGRRVVPPLLIQKKPLVDETERRLPPGRMVKPAILGQGLDAGRGLGCRRGAHGMDAEARRLPQRLFEEGFLLARRSGEMKGPIEVGERETGRRDRRRKPPHRHVHEPIDARGRFRSFAGSRGRAARLRTGRDPGFARSIRRAAGELKLWTAGLVRNHDCSSLLPGTGVDMPKFRGLPVSRH